jgi:ABC-type glutathione transport system ATPase component
MTLLELQDVSASYGRREAVRQATLAMDRGEIVGLVGESGSGKTTLGNCVTGLMRLTAGEIWFAGKLVSRAGMRPRVPWAPGGVQGIYQDPASALNPRLSVGGLIDEVLRVHRVVRRSEVSARRTQLLDQVGLSPSIRKRRARELSGGQCQRVAIARALALNPGVLVADEIVSSLDASVQAQVLNLLTVLSAAAGIAVLLITHDLAVVRQVCDRVAVMHDGQLVETGPADAVLSRPEHEYTIALLDALPRLQGGR